MIRKTKAGLFKPTLKDEKVITRLSNMSTTDAARWLSKEAMGLGCTEAQLKQFVDEHRASKKIKGKAEPVIEAAEQEPTPVPQPEPIMEPKEEPGQEKPGQEEPEPVKEEPKEKSKVDENAKPPLEFAKETFEKVLISGQDSPGDFYSEAFFAAVRVLRTDLPTWAECRIRLKKVLPAGARLSDIEKATELPGDRGGVNDDSIAADLTELVNASGELFFDSRGDKTFVSVEMEGVTHTLAIYSKAFNQWLSYSYYKTTKERGGRGKSASAYAINQACRTLAGIALHEGTDQRVYLRVADHNDGHYIFMGDKRLRVIEVMPTGWQIIEKAPVKFWKSDTMQPLPTPERGGDIDKLWDFVNIPKEERPLALAWFFESLRTETPNPPLALSGGYGNAKSGAQDMLCQLIDNNSVNLSASPVSVLDVFVSAGCNWLASYNNLSHLSAPMQDAFCTLSTGGGITTRTLYTNNEETAIEAKRPIIINSISRVVTAQDLTDRTIHIELPDLRVVKEETLLWAEWNAAKPLIYGALLDLFVKTLAFLPKVILVKPPRMADFTRLGEAMMQAQGFPAGTFDTLYKANRLESVAIALESSPVAVAVVEFTEKDKGTEDYVFYGTVGRLLATLEDGRVNIKNWPRSPRGLADALRRQAPALITLGIVVKFGKKVERIGKDQGIPVTITMTKAAKEAKAADVKAAVKAAAVKAAAKMAAYNAAAVVQNRALAQEEIAWDANWADDGGDVGDPKC